MTNAPRQRRPTIADVARRAGVSTASVSYVMNGLPGVGDQTRSRVLEVAREMGWTPSGTARALTRARANAIGLVLARDPEELESDPFTVRFLSGIERTLAADECALVLQMAAPTGSEINLEPYHRLLDSGRVDGFLLADPLHDDPRFAILAEAATPVVVVGDTGGQSPFPVLETNHLEGMAMIVEHLLSLGHERLGFVGASEVYEHVHTRRDVWEATIRAAGHEPGPVAYATPADPAGTAATLAVLEDPTVTAITYTTDMLAVAGMTTAREAGRNVPDAVSMTGFDDSQFAATFGLTSVRVDYRELGAGATAHLLALIAGDEPPEFTPTRPELHLRASSAPPAVARLS